MFNLKISINKYISSIETQKKKEFEKFLVRKRPSDDRRDITIFNDLFMYYNSSQIRKITYKGNQKYHAIRKRLARELINFIILSKLFWLRIFSLL